MNTAQSFLTAAFTPDGGLIGTGEWRASDLSRKWLSVCQGLLDRNGPVFRVSPGQMLSHLEVAFTSSRGSGMGMFFAHGHLGVSTAYFRGDDHDVEAQVQSMFLDSLRRTAIVQRLATSADPFSALPTLTHRPLHVFIPWGVAAIADEDHELLLELANHFAAAFLFTSAAGAA